jgi:hypothetical protein
LAATLARAAALAAGAVFVLAGCAGLPAQPAAAEAAAAARGDRYALAAPAATAPVAAVAVPGAPELATGFARRPLLRAQRYAGVSAHPLASQAACRVLAEGGAAVDAALAAQLVLAVVEPQSSGLGGGGFLLHWDGAARRVSAWDGRERAPAASRPDDLRWIDADERVPPRPSPRDSGRAVGVPQAQWAPQAMRLAAAHSSSVGAGVRVAVLDTDDGAHVVNFSLGSLQRTRLLEIATRIASRDLDDDDEDEEAYTADDQTRCNQRHGAVVIAAAGNGGSPTEQQFPAAEIQPKGFTGALAVTASNAQGRRADFGNHGPWVQIAAPGEGITSTVPGGGWGTWSGSSMAAPLAAGLAALVIASGHGPTPDPSPQPNPDPLRTWAPSEVVQRLRNGSAAMCPGSQPPTSPCRHTPRRPPPRASPPKTPTAQAPVYQHPPAALGVARRSDAAAYTL